MFNIEILEAKPVFDGETPMLARMFDEHFPSLFVTVTINGQEDGKTYPMTVKEIPPFLHPEGSANGTYNPRVKLGQCSISHPAYVRFRDVPTKAA